MNHAILCLAGAFIAAGVSLFCWAALQGRRASVPTGDDIEGESYADEMPEEK